MSTDQPWTIGRLLTWTTEFLKGKGAEEARLDAQLLLAHVLGCDKVSLYTRFHEEPTEAQRTAFRELVQRRAKGCPVAYLLGAREFFSLTFEVTPDEALTLKWLKDAATLVGNIDVVLRSPVDTGTFPSQTITFDTMSQQFGIGRGQ